MSTTTTNYGLIKPETDDPILVGQLNDNMDTIDTVLKDHSDKIDAAALGIKYKGEVNYYADLPNSAKIGDAYTVKYAGSSGTTPDGTEYVWGAVSGTNQWINFSKDSYTKAEVDALLALKQNALSSTQLDAVNSGINSEKVAQIETNENNISSLVDAGAKNLLRITTSSQTINGVTFTVNADGTVTANGTAMNNDAAFLISDQNFKEMAPAGTTFFGGGCPSGGSKTTYLIGFNYLFTDTGDGTGYRAYPENPPNTNVVIVVKKDCTVNNLTFKPMLCTAKDYIISPKFVPYAMSNAELTAAIQALQAQLANQ